MSRFVNLPTSSGNEVSIRVDAIIGVREVKCASSNRSRVFARDGFTDEILLSRPEVFRRMGLHLSANGEDWV